MLAGMTPDNLMGRVLQDLMPAYDVLKVAREARAAGLRVVTEIEVAFSRSMPGT